MVAAETASVLFCLVYIVGIMKDGGKTSPWNAVGRVLGTVFPESRRDSTLTPYKIWEIWPDVVGGSFARSSEPWKYDGGKLFVRVSHPALIQDLLFAKERVRRDLNLRLEADVVKQIHFVRGSVSPTKYPAAPKRPLPKYSELSPPRIDNVQIQSAFEALLRARRIRLTSARTSYGFKKI